MKSNEQGNFIHYIFKDSRRFAHQVYRYTDYTYKDYHS